MDKDVRFNFQHALLGISRDAWLKRCEIKKQGEGDPIATVVYELVAVASEILDQAAALIYQEDNEQES